MTDLTPARVAEMAAARSYVVTGITSKFATKGSGRKVFLYWTTEGGGSWEWGFEEWAKRFETEEAAARVFPVAQRAGPHWHRVEAESISVEAVKIRDMFKNCAYDMAALIAKQKAEIERLRRGVEAIAPWMSAAIDDPSVCQEMKADIETFFTALEAKP